MERSSEISNRSFPIRNFSTLKTLDPVIRSGTALIALEISPISEKMNSKDIEAYRFFGRMNVILNSCAQRVEIIYYATGPGKDNLSSLNILKSHLCSRSSIDRQRRHRLDWTYTHMEGDLILVNLFSFYLISISLIPPDL